MFGNRPIELVITPKSLVVVWSCHVLVPVSFKQRFPGTGDALTDRVLRSNVPRGFFAGQSPLSRM